MDMKILLFFAVFLTFTSALHLSKENHLASTPCISPGQLNVTTGLCNCVNGSIADPKNGTCVCSQEKPYFVSSQCINCPLPSYFNKTSQKC